VYSLGGILRGKSMGRVEDRLTPALPHQTVHAVFPHTAFRCSSRQGMRGAPAGGGWKSEQPIAPVQIHTRETAFTDSSVFHLMTLHQVCAQQLFCVGLDLLHHLIGIAIVEVVGQPLRLRLTFRTISSSAMGVSSRPVAISPHRQHARPPPTSVGCVECCRNISTGPRL
jgi:hypothetical protein